MTSMQEQARQMLALNEKIINAKPKTDTMADFPPLRQSPVPIELIAASLAGGLIASGKTGHEDTPEGAIACYRAVLETLKADQAKEKAGG